MAVVAAGAAAIIAYTLFALFGAETGPETRGDGGVEASGTAPGGAPPSLPVADADADLSGRVVDTAGEPIAGVEITARPEAIDAAARDVDAGAGLSLDAEVVTRTGPGGRFALAGLGAGHVRLEIAGPAVIASEVRFVAVPRRGLEVVAAREVSIAGRVSGDGAIAGITVTAVGESTRATASTGAGGEFAITGLPEGVYRVFAAAGERGSPALRVERRGAGPFEAIELAMAPAAIISGRLIDAETGAPLAGQVVLTHDGDEPPRQGESTAAGQFAIEGVPPGRWYAEAAAPGYVGADSLAFSADRSRELTLRLSRGGSLAGVVLDPDGIPVSGALVEADGGAARAAAPRPLPRFVAGGNFIPRGELGVMTGPIPFPPAQPIEASRIAEPIASSRAAPIDRSGSQRMTDDRGRFRIVGLEPGRYQLLASHPDFAGGASAPVVIALGASREGIEVLMTRGVRIRGVVRDERGDPIVAARVTASSAGPMPAAAHTDPAGRFVLPPLTGKTTLTASASGYAAATLEIAEPDGEEVAFQLERADGSIAGRVADPAGFPLRGARVSVRGQAAAAVTDDGGRFELGNLARGRFEIIVRHPDYPEHRVELETGRGHELEVPLGGGIEGLVVDTASRRPMAATVMIRGAGKPRAPAVTIQSSDGRFERAPLAAGRYTVRAAAPGYAAASTTVEVRAGSRPKQVTVHDVLLELERGASIAGTVRDENGDRVAGATVRAGGVEGTTDIDGGFSLRDVPAVRDLEIVAEKGDRRGAIELTLTPGDELTTIEISIEP